MASSPTRLTLPSTDIVTHRCSTRKVGYPNKGAAWNVAEWMMQQGHVDPGCHIVHYHCDECGAWHVGNQVIVKV